MHPVLGLDSVQFPGLALPTKRYLGGSFLAETLLIASVIV